MTQKHEDLTGRAIAPGQFVVYAGAESTLKYGYVTGTNLRPGWQGGTYATIKVITAARGYTGTISLQRRGGSVTLRALERCVVVPDDTVPQAVRDMLLAASQRRHRF